MKIKTIIIDDVKSIRTGLIKLISKHCPQIELLGEADNIVDAEKLIKETNPDLIFLDIQIKDQTGFDLLQNLQSAPSLNYRIIFMTAHQEFEHATRAIDYSALDFISKPIDHKKLSKAVEKAELMIVAEKMKQVQQEEKDRSYMDQIKMLLGLLSMKNEKPKKIPFHLVKGILEYIEIDKILKLEAEQNITNVFLVDGTAYTAMKNLGYYSKLLTGDYHFFTINKSTVINLDHVKRYKHSELEVTLIDGSIIHASRRGGKLFKDLINSEESIFPNLQKDSVLRKLLDKLKDL